MHIASVVPLVFVFMSAALTGCQSGSASTSQNVSAHPTNPAASFAVERTATIWVKGMTCPFCASNLETYIARIDGMERIDANLATGRVLVQVTSFDGDTESKLRKAVDDSGFTVDRFEFPK